MASGLWLLVAAGNSMMWTFLTFTPGRKGGTCDAVLLWACRGRSDTDFIGYCSIGPGSVSTLYLSMVAPASQDNDVGEVTMRPTSSADDTMSAIIDLNCYIQNDGNCNGGERRRPLFDLVTLKAASYALFSAMRRSKFPLGVEGRPFNFGW
eukprot:CAMPEP_0172509048 /NCGR_PEP_ID=MMETSP1066-20121228/217181_1 /TAXON_ID=671091 /ORGANISM="Coscinodiscus wailesii, Strain CCMP2513" /LENGTH=150 /DNA_ID=CAMNT_0013287353 /DNA_START=149 /DNA_END=601 /DNA_ORIENTATION=+